MALFRLNPITKKRWQRFRRIRHGYWSLIILVVATFISLFSNYIANNRAIVVSYEGKLHFPTWKFIPMETFGQEDEYGFTDAEADYAALQEQWKGTDNWLIMPPIRFNPYQTDLDHYDTPPPHAPDKRHLLGTDSVGRDVFARLLYGFRLGILFSLLLVAATTLFGVALGSLEGYLGGRFDIVAQRLIEIWSMLPSLYVIIIIGTAIQGNFWSLLVIMALFGWMGITYYMRTEMLREREREYCLAARAAGASTLRIIFKHLLPNCLTPLITTLPFAVVGGITALTALDFLGYGLPPPTPSWGELMSQALDLNNRGKYWLVISPFAAIAITLTLVTFVGESIREALDPRQRTTYR